MTSIHPGLIGLLIMGPMIFSMLAIVYVGHYYVESFEAMMPNSRIVRDYRRVFSSAGLVGKLMRTGSISMILMMPKMYARRGLVDLDEVRGFPRRLKRVLVGLHLLLFVLLSALVGFRFLLL
ncbi:hypothetical protein [Pseudomonas putida]|uniref:hypothetical protein n=1 Tax=Pseudomonas putida TaxID=303 RepID=UPI0020C36A0B|nr:hypothetical protein [Pseudomonas putida]UTL80745.1 hypothetical protein NL778_22700 [Pseudomonas putida]